MDFFECVEKRRSIRKFTGEKVTEEELRRILQAGIAAPSAGNMQAREFILAKTKESITGIAGVTDTGITARGGRLTQEWIAGADVAVVICFDEKRMAARYGDKGRYTMTLLDCMGVAQNMMLAVTALGLGSTCVIGFDAAALKKLLSVPVELTPLLVLPIGRPAEEGAGSYRMGIEDLVRFEC